MERDYLEREFVTGVNYSYHQKVKINFSSVKLHPKAEIELNFHTAIPCPTFGKT